MLDGHEVSQAAKMDPPSNEERQRPLSLAPGFLAEGLPLSYGASDIGRVREMMARDLLRLRIN